MRVVGRMGLLLYDALKDIPDLRIYGPPPGADGYLNLEDMPTSQFRRQHNSGVPTVLPTDAPYAMPHPTECILLDFLCIPVY